MEAGRHQHGDPFAVHAPGQKAFDQRPQEQVIGHRPRDIADQDARTLAPANQFGIRQSADGAGQRVTDGALRIRQLGQGALANDGCARIRWQRDA
jgi:hypothetical protein